MISADAFVDAALECGIDFFTGVPCSFLTPVINRVISDERVVYVGATSEGEAVALAAGAWLAGRRTMVMIQNSGLGNAVNPLTSLNYPFRIPTLLLTTWRGQPGIADEPQHELMGQIMHKLLALMNVSIQDFPSDEGALAVTFSELVAEMEETGLPGAFVLPDGVVVPGSLDERPMLPPGRGVVLDRRAGGPLFSRLEALQSVLDTVPDDVALIATTGKTGRELFMLADREQHFYLVGSMGCASALGLGVALNSARPVVVLDGDGSVLMKMGNLATIGACRPRNLVHVLLDNGVHDSTGGQATVSPCIDFTAIAIASGYATAYDCDDKAGFANTLATVLEASAGPVLIRLAISPGSAKNLPRPTVKPADVARRFRAFLSR